MMTHGMRHTTTYRSWSEMRQRCHNPNNDKYKWYGARGISVCARWRDSFENFYEDMGARPDGMTLDRIETNGNYEKDNCRWATKQTQMNNMRSNRVVSVDGRELTMTEASRIWHVPVGTIWRRLQLGWATDDAVKRTVRAHKIYERAMGKI